MSLRGEEEICHFILRIAVTAASRSAHQMGLIVGLAVGLIVRESVSESVFPIMTRDITKPAAPDAIPMINKNPSAQSLQSIPLNIDDPA